MKNQSSETLIAETIDKRLCGLFTNIAPLYTRPLWKELVSSERIKYTFYTSATGYSGIKVIDIQESKNLNCTAEFDWFFLRNVYLKNILIYQVGVVSKCIAPKFDAYIFNGEFQCVSNWIASIICRIKHKPVLFWGHGFYGNERLFKRVIRKLFYRLADYHLIYGDRSKELMVKSGFKSDTIYTVHNSLDYELHNRHYSERSESKLLELKKKLFPRNFSSPVVIFIGRLTKEKKLIQLIRALADLRLRKRELNCVIIGDGEQSESLKKETNSLNLSDNIIFYGSCHDEMINANLIMLSDCCVSPGNVGLTAIHCLSLGTPVITHKNLSNQGPEVESVIEYKTGLFFEENNVEDLAFAIEKLVFVIKKTEMEVNCTNLIRRFWNPIFQASVFEKAILDATESI
jgi:glycosyltransferase involved in cell wall biosynthesis